MKKLSPKNVKIIGAAFLGILLFAGYFFVVQPLINTFNNNSASVQDAQTRIDTLSTQVATLRSASQDEETINTLQAELTTRFPSSADVPELIRNISAAALAAGIPANDISNFSFETPTVVAPEGAAAGAEGSTEATATEENAAAPTAEEETTTPTDETATGTDVAATTSDLAEMGVTLSVTGSRDQFAIFLSALTNLPRVITVNSFDIAVSSEESSSLTLSGTTFLYRAIAVPAPTTETAPSETESAE